MGSWAFPAALFLLCLAPESSLQGGFGNPNGYRSGFGSPSGLGAVLVNENGLGTQSGPPASNGYTAGYGNRLAAGAFPGVGAQPGLEESAKPQKPGYGHGYGLGAQAAEAGQAREFGNGNGLGTGAFPRAGVQPGYGGVLKPQKPGMAQNGFGAGFGGGRKAQKPGYGTGLPAGAFPGPGAQPGYGYGWAVQPGGKPPKPGYRNGMGVGAFPGAGAQPGERDRLRSRGGPRRGLSLRPSHLPVSPGLGGVGKSQKHPGYSTGNGLVAQPGYQPMHGYGPPGPGTDLGFGGDLKLQQVGFAYRRGILGLFPDARLQPGA
ncbi:glycine-rich extracellular protein 1 [Ochotona princeps]|uniref:glycine-rich extracellular protein 1 n=1 Tax=Ochotona princeps TaxID=9978 RepID=UPI0027147D73|nr:glycine-rich extracellular protein 1 [Ochotona princeps]